MPESYETLYPKVVASWRWSVATHDFGFWMHADDDSYVRLDLLLEWLSSPFATPNQGLYAGYIWDGSEGRRTKPLRDPAAKNGEWHAFENIYRCRTESEQILTRTFLHYEDMFE